MQLILDGNIIDQANFFNFLGLTLNENIFLWNGTTIIIDKIANKRSKTLEILNKLKHVMPTHVKIILYNTLILPHINYAIAAWGHKCKIIVKLQKKQWE